jgi:phosphohistidine phosphatase
MKTLVLFRHAKSDWDSEFDLDHDRPLNKRGKRDAKRMGRFLSAAGGVPERVVTSSAVRAVKTVGLAASAGGWQCEIVVDESLYEADPRGVVDLIQGQPDASDAVLLAGHEPAFSETASLLIGGGALRFPTAAMACIEFEAARWADIRAGGGSLVWLMTPKLLGEAGAGD